jgi:cytoskeletal protein RodZ
VTVGQTLTEARSQAGLTVDELSERTRIRGTVIRSIEQDDYEACGGDLYVRGYVRALAGAVGIDAQPLIREFELGRAGQGSEHTNGSTGRHAKGYPAAAAPDAPTAFDLPAVTADAAGEDDPSATRLDLPPVTGDPAATAFDLPPVTGDPVPAGYDIMPQAWPGQPGDSTAIMPALGYEPAAPQALPGPPGTARKNRRAFIAAVAAGLIVMAALGVVGVRLAAGGPPARSAADAGASAASASAAAARASAAAQASAAASASAAAQASASAAAQASASAAAKASAAQAAANAVIRLPVAAALAFGPDGFADGDNPGNAKYAISGGASQSWSTQWYSTPEFGMLKHGTGLLLDLGGKVTVSSVVIDLGNYGGANLEIRVGNGTAPQNLQVAATASNVGGVLRLTLDRPAPARYLLIWITKLPPDGSGHYAEAVSHVQVTGRR